jgi:hypothetical protein
MNFLELLERSKTDPDTIFSGRFMTFDPGETTGWSLWERTRLADFGQLKTYPIETGVNPLQTLLFNRSPTRVVYESYHIYSWKTDDHTNSDVPALQVVGMLRTLCYQASIPVSSQTAQVAKQFCTDEKLKEWGIYQPGMRHARDAIRHGAYFLLFGKTGQAGKPDNQKPT